MKKKFKKKDIRFDLGVYFDPMVWISSKQQYFITKHWFQIGCKLVSQRDKYPLKKKKKKTLGPSEGHKVRD